MRFHSRSVALLRQAATRVMNKALNISPTLPADFDPEAYLQLNPDVQKAGVDAERHYLRFGHREGRVFVHAHFAVAGAHHVRAGRDTILIVNHDASRTGAPVLGLNLVQRLVDRYNVVALLLGDGPLVESFQQAGAAVIVAAFKGRPDELEPVVRQLCRRFPLRFAIANSIESREVLNELALQFIPSVILIHEFSCYTRPRHAFPYAFLWSSEVVFSAPLTRDNALAEFPELRRCRTHILPQGQCIPPSTESSAAELEHEIARFKRQLRPPGSENTTLIIGLGSVHQRKGADLFIECAARIRRIAGDAPYRFVWIGKGYDPESDMIHSVYLAEQVQRSGMQDHLFFIADTSAIATAYQEADLLLLTSRLDPLPNVAIDALLYGLPMLAFDKASGISDYLISIGLGEACVAAHLDTADMAEKAVALINSPARRTQIAQTGRERAAADFNMDRYVAQIEQLAEQSVVRMRQEKLDTQTIIDSGVFRSDFANPPWRAAEQVARSVRTHVRSWSANLFERQAFPGFHPGIYLEQHGIAGPYVTPLADYLRASRPAGPWQVPVIHGRSAAAIDLPANNQIALHLHVYYVDLLPDILWRLEGNQIRPDLFISVPSEAVRSAVLRELRSYSGKVVDLQVVENRGRDIAPLLTGFGPTLIADYDFIGHLHTKKSPHGSDVEMGKTWFRFLLENLLGGKSGAMADRILTQMKQDSHIGMVFPDDPYVVGMNSNRPMAETLAQRMGLKQLPEHFAFPTGTMFWARAAALQPVMDLQLGWDDYPEEPLPYDGSILHALERLLSLSLSKSDLQYAVTNVEGVTR